MNRRSRLVHTRHRQNANSENTPYGRLNNREWISAFNPPRVPYSFLFVPLFAPLFALFAFCFSLQMCPAPTSLGSLTVAHNEFP